MRLRDGDITREVFKVVEGVLNYMEVLLDAHQYRKMRSRVLRLGNDCIRNLTEQNQKTGDEQDE